MHLNCVPFLLISGFTGSTASVSVLGLPTGSVNPPNTRYHWMLATLLQLKTQVTSCRNPWMYVSSCPMIVIWHSRKGNKCMIVFRNGGRYLRPLAPRGRYPAATSKERVNTMNLTFTILQERETERLAVCTATMEARVCAYTVLDTRGTSADVTSHDVTGRLDITSGKIISMK